MPPPVERFAPSPNGHLHPGHAFSALTAFEAAQAAGGRFLVRVEDLDQTRARPDLVDAMLEDLAWIGLAWERPELRQSQRFGAYRDALASLEARGLTYPCFCTRRDIQDALSAAHPDAGAQDRMEGPDGPAYPGVCRGLSAEARAKKLRSDAAFAVRLDMRKAVAAIGGAGVVRKLAWKEIGRGPKGEKGRIGLDPDFLIQACGDIVLARKDAPASYHLAVTLDDAFQEVTHVTRGCDLFAATAIHRLLQALLGRPTPIYRHHRLILDAHGKRLAKRDGAESLRALREAGAAPADIRAQIGL